MIERGLQPVRRVTAILFVCAIALAAQGCTRMATKTMAGVDQAISTVAQADCELARIARGDDICREPAPMPAPAPVYCYKRLGGVDCYASRDPMDQPIVREAKATPEPTQTTALTSY